MKVVLAIFALLCAVSIVSSQRIIDDFIVDQDPLQVNAGTTSAATTAQDAERILGGERDTTLTLDPNSVGTCRVGLSSTTNVNVAGFLDANNNGQNDFPGDNGIFVAANDQSCFARTVVFYNGVGGGGLAGADRDFNNIGAAFHIRYFSDLNGRQFLLRVNSGANSCTTTLTTTGGQIVDDRTIPYGAFSTGCDFSNVNSLEIDIPAQSNFDVTISLFEFVAASLSGRVWNDCACDNTFNGSDSPVFNLLITAAPTTGGNCPAGTATLTTRTANDGTYRFSSLGACSYTVSVPSETTTCGNSPRTQTRTTVIGQEVTNVNFNLPVASTLTPPGPLEFDCDDVIPATKATLSSACGTSDVTTFSDTNTQNFVCPVNGATAQNRIITRTFSAGGQTATQTITVFYDSQPPTFTNPANVALTCQQFPSNPNTTPIPTSLSGAPQMTDNCSTPTFTFLDSITENCDTTICGASFTVFRTFTVRDSCGNTAPGLGTSQRIDRGACSATGSFVCPIQSVCGVNPPPPPPPNVPPPPPQTGECNGNTNSRTTNTLSNGVTVDTNSLTTNTNSRTTITSDDAVVGAFTNSRTTLTNSENPAGATNTKTTITSGDVDNPLFAFTNSRTSLTNSENFYGSPTPNTSNDSPLPVDSTANSPNESPNASPIVSSVNASPIISSNILSSNNIFSSNNNSSATSLAASLVALVALFFLF